MDTYISSTVTLLSFSLEQKKGKKGKKGKKEKDLTPDRSMHTSYPVLLYLPTEFNICTMLFSNRSIEDLYTELVREGIVIKCPKTRLSEFVGEYRYTVHIHMNTFHYQRLVL